MDKIAEHMELLKNLEKEETQQQRNKQLDHVIKAHEPTIMKAYEEMMADIESVLEKHAPKLIGLDVAFDRDCAAIDGRPQMSEGVLFLSLTSQYILHRIEKYVATWALKRLQAYDKE